MIKNYNKTKTKVFYIYLKLFFLIYIIKKL